MKNIFKTGAYLIAFATAGIVFQISCSNSDDSKAIETLNPMATSKIIYTKQSTGNPPELWTSNYDGSIQTQIPVALPANVAFSMINNNGSSFKLSPDGQKVFFVAFNNSTNLSSVYSCDISGGNLQEIIAPSTFVILELGGVN